MSPRPRSRSRRRSMTAHAHTDASSPSLPSRRRTAAWATRGHDGALPTEDDVRRILGSVGAEVEDRLNLLFALMEGKDITRLIAAGREQLAYACSGGATAVVAAPAAAATEAEEDAKEEEEEKEDVGLFNLFN